MRRKAKYLKESPEDKQLRMVLISIIGSIFLCMTCLVGTTWAYFQTTLTIEDNVLTIGKLEVAVALVRGDQAQREMIEPSGQYTYELDEIGTYSITLINSGSFSGFCTVKLTDNQGNVESFSTGTLNAKDSGLEDSATIELTVTPEDILNDTIPVTMEITPHWGEDPAYTIAAEDVDVFVPTEETVEETTEATESEIVPVPPITPDTEPDETTGSTVPENTVEATEEATEPEASTEITQNTESTESTEQTITQTTE